MYTLDTLRADLTARVSLSADPVQVKGWQDSATREMIDSCWWRIVHVTFTDVLIGSAVRRWVLGGEKITVLPSEYQIAPDGVTPKFFLPFTSIDWRQRAPDDIIIEPNVSLAGDASTTTPPTGVIVANIAPVPDQSAPTNTWVRIWYQRRVPQPDYSLGTSPIYAPDEFARIATLGYYLGVLSDNQAGGDLRLWRKRSEEYLNQADRIYSQAVPLVSTFPQKADDWLVTGVAS